MSVRTPPEIDFSRLAHDLRGPLMPLRTAAWLLRQEPDASERVQELADIIDRQSVRLTHMMDELSEWGLATTGQNTPNLKPADIALTLDLAIGSLSGCNIEPLISEEAARFPLNADPHGLGLLLRTLIGHASDRDAGAQPEVVVSVYDDQLKIQVRDRGASLDAAARDALFTQPQPNPSDNGLGLRLMLARKIAEAHGGSLSIDSTIREGLAVICLLPSAFVPGLAHTDLTMKA